MSTFSNVKIFAGSESNAFTHSVCQELQLPVSKNRVIKFSEGNIFVEFQEKVQQQHVIIIQSLALNVNESFIELLFWIDAAKRNGAQRITTVIPYYGYAKSDKPDGIGTSIRGRVCADCLEMVGAQDIVVMDLHSPQIQGFFRQPVYHLTALPIFADQLKTQFANQMQDLVIVSPDAGYEKNARRYAETLSVPLAIGEKDRPDHSEKPIIHQIGGASVKNKIAIVVDDFTISGGTLIEISKKLREQGAQQVVACISHALLSEASLNKMDNSDIDEIWITDTVANQHLHSHPKIKVVSVAPLFAQTIKELL